MSLSSGSSFPIVAGCLAQLHGVFGLVVTSFPILLCAGAVACVLDYGGQPLPAPECAVACVLDYGGQPLPQAPRRARGPPQGFCRIQDEPRLDACTGCPGPALQRVRARWPDVK
eukprot:1159597-Pelagomonas_calceolata.AAC.12